MSSIFYVKSGLLFNVDAAGDIGSALNHRPNNIYAAASVHAPSVVASSSLTIASLSGVLKASAGLVSGSATTTDLPEGSNLYYTAGRVQSVGDARYLKLDGSNSPMTGAIDMGGFQIHNAADPSSAQDLATKAYVDANVSADAANRFLSNLQSPTAINQDLLFGSDGVKDIGASSSSRPNNAYIKTLLQAGSAKITGFSSAGVVHNDASGNLSSSLIVNADVSSSAAIAYSKLNLSASIVNADIASGAAIAYNKLAALTANRALQSDGSGFVSASSVTNTELGYLSGVTSAIQTQINNKVSKSGDTMSGSLLFSAGDLGDATHRAGNLFLSTEIDINGNTIAAASGFGNNYSMSAGSLVGSTYIDFSSVINFTFSIWVKTTATSEIILFNNYDYSGSNPNFIAFYMNAPGNAGKISYFVPGGIANTVGSGYNDGNWHQFVFAWADSSNLTIYVDGSLIHTSGSNSGNVINNTHPINISPSADPISSGALDEAAFFNVALSSGQVTTIYNSGTPTDLSLQSSLIHWYRMGDLDDTTSLVKDRKGSIDLTGTSVSFGSDVPGGAFSSSAGLKATTSTFEFSGNVKVDSLSTGIVHSDSSGLLTSSLIVNADISGSAAIAYSKLSLTNSIVNADINSSAAIAYSKLAALTANRALQSDGSGFVSASSVTSTELGYVSGVTSSIQSQLDNRLKLDGSNSPSADISWGSHKITNLSDPASAQDAATKHYVDALAQGLKPKAAVRAASNGSNINLSSALINGAVVDGVTLATGDRVLVKDQTLPQENGIYIVAASGAASRSSDMDSLTPVDEINGAYTFIQEGSQAGQGWVEQSHVATLGTDPMVWVYFNSVATMVGGDMITVTGPVISVDLAAASGLESTNPGNNAGQLRVKLEASNPSLKFTGSNELAAKLYGSGAILSGASGLYVNVDGSTIDISGNAIEVKAGGITNTQVSASAAIAYSKLALSASIKASDQNSQSATSVQPLFADGSGGAAYRSIVSGDLPDLSGIYANIHLSNLSAVAINADLKFGTDAANNIGNITTVGPDLTAADHRPQYIAASKVLIVGGDFGDSGHNVADSSLNYVVCAANDNSHGQNFVRLYAFNSQQNAGIQFNNNGDTSASIECAGGMLAFRNNAGDALRIYGDSNNSEVWLARNSAGQNLKWNVDGGGNIGGVAQDSYYQDGINYVANAPGASGVTINIVDDGGPVSVSVSGSDVTVHIDGQANGNSTTTDDVVAAIEAYPAAAALLTPINQNPGSNNLNDSGGAQPLSGGGTLGNRPYNIGLQNNLYAAGGAYVASFINLASLTASLPVVSDGAKNLVSMSYASFAGHLSHSALLNLSADDHAQYLLLAGRSGGQVAHGGNASGNDLTLSSTSHATKGNVRLNDGSQFLQESDPSNLAEAYLGPWGGYSSLISTQDAALGAIIMAGSQGGTFFISLSGQGPFSTPTQNLHNDRVFDLQVMSYNGSGDYGTGQIQVADFSAEAEEAYSPTAMGTRFVFRTVQDGTTTLTKRMVIDGAGQIQITSSSNANLVWTVDGAGDIGAEGNYRPGSLFLKNQLWIGTGVQDSGAVSTTDATPTSVYSLALADNSAYIVTAMIVGRRTDSADRVMIQKIVGVYREAGTPAIATPPGQDSTLFEAGEMSWDASFSLSGNNLVLQVTGEAAANIDWSCSISYQIVS